MKNQIPYLCDLAIEAGQITLKYFQKNPEILTKSDGSHVTLADQLTEKFIIKGLQKISDDVIISEENFEEFPIERTEATTFWLVDPIDGTNQFIKGKDEYTVNIALIKDGYPVLGVIYAPATDELYFTKEGKTYKKQGASLVPLTAQAFEEQNVNIIIGVSAMHSPHVKDYMRSHHINSHHYLASSLKFCKMAEGLYNLYPRFTVMKEWDTAAGQAILEQAGGSVTDFEGNRLSYGKLRFNNPPFIAKGYCKGSH